MEHPQAGVDYPKNWHELIAWFPDDAALVTSIAASGDAAHVSMPEVYRLASLLKRWLLGTHQGAVSHDQLDFYLDEFTFRFNRRHARHRGLLFYRLLEQVVATEPHPLSGLYSAAATE